MKMKKIFIEYIFPPIPNRNFDWCAFYDPETKPYGYGKTKEEAIKDLEGWG